MPTKAARKTSRRSSKTNKSMKTKSHKTSKKMSKKMGSKKRHSRKLSGGAKRMSKKMGSKKRHIRKLSGGDIRRVSKKTTKRKSKGKTIKSRSRKMKGGDPLENPDPRNNPYIPSRNSADTGPGKTMTAEEHIRWVEGQEADKTRFAATTAAMTATAQSKKDERAKLIEQANIQLRKPFIPSEQSAEAYKKAMDAARAVLAKLN